MRILVLALAASLCACSSGQRTAHRKSESLLAIAESGGRERGKELSARPSLTVRNAEAFDVEMWRDLRENFLSPVERGPWRYVVDTITLDAEPLQTGDWTLLVSLDTGASFKIDDFSDYDAARHSYFSRGLKRTMEALEQIQRKDDSLDRYVKHWQKRGNSPD